MTSYTERFSEGSALLATIAPASYSSEQNTGYVSMAQYPRLFVICHAGVLGQNVDFDVEQGTTTAGGTTGSFDSASKDFLWTASTDNDAVTVIEIRAEELTAGYLTINIEATPAGSSSIFAVEVWGDGGARYAPVSTTNLDSVED